MDQDNTPSSSWKTEMKEIFTSLEEEITDEIMSQFKATEDLEPHAQKAKKVIILRRNNTRSQNFCLHKQQHYKLLGEFSFEDLVEEFATTGKKIGSAVDKKLATMVEELIKSKLPKPKLEEIINKYPRPENCILLISPKVNRAVWNELSQKYKS